MEGDTCDNCDNCRRPPDTWNGTTAAQKALSCIARTGQRFGSGHVTDVLLGNDTEKVQRHNHDTVSTYGIGADRSKTEWRSILRQLVAKGMVTVDVMGYGALTLTETCRPVLKGNESVALRNPVALRDGAAASASSSTTKTATDDPLPADGPERALFEALRERRTQLATDQDVPPYVIFNDKTLRAMVEHRPQTRSDFRALHGVGDVKLDRYGDAFMEVIETHA
jgi:ATP-dependent DNA helicase RecQ